MCVSPLYARISGAHHDGLQERDGNEIRWPGKCFHSIERYNYALQPHLPGRIVSFRHGNESEVNSELTTR